MDSTRDTVSLREFFNQKFENIDDKLETIIAKQDITNGRVRRAEVAIAILQWAYGIGAAVVAGWFFNLIKR